MRAGEAFQLANNAAAGTTPVVYLLGGKYQIDYAGTGTGTVDLYTVGPDGVTGIKVATQITATTGQQTLDLPPGAYYAIIATFTASYLRLTRVPEE